MHNMAAKLRGNSLNGMARTSEDIILQPYSRQDIASRKRRNFLRLDNRIIHKIHLLVEKRIAWR